MRYSNQKQIAEYVVAPIIENLGLAADAELAFHVATQIAGRSTSGYYLIARRFASADAVAELVLAG